MRNKGPVNLEMHTMHIKQGEWMNLRAKNQITPGKKGKPSRKFPPLKGYQSTKLRSCSYKVKSHVVN